MKAHSILALVLLAASTPALAQRTPDPPIKEACAQLKFSSPEATGLPKNPPSFSAVRTIDVTIGVTLQKDLKLEQVLRLKVLLPSGHLYQTLTVPVVAPGTSPEKARKGVVVAGFRRPVPAVIARQDASVSTAPWQVEVAFPVGGTPIVGNSLYGTWSVLVYRDDETLPCAFPATFTIVP
jgi:hypothetical protein